MPLDALSPRVFGSWLPPQDASAVDWIPANVEMPEELEQPGPFDLELMPHVLGVLELVDDPMIRNIFLCWAARNGKTITALAVMMFLTTCKPAPSLFASCNADKAKDCVNSQFYPLLEKCNATRRQLLPKHQRSPDYIALERCRVRIGYSGSPGTLAGFPACYGHATEVSKWNTNKSREASPVYLMLQRGKLYPFESKFIFESSPGLKGQCQITELCESNTTERRFRYVPCPHCGHRQRLHFGGKDVKGGIKWERDSRGRSDPIRAEETAKYQCERCEYLIDNHERPRMMRDGIWLPEGLTVDDHGKISGERRLPDGSSDVSLGPLSTLYSLMISGWGQIAKEFLTAIDADRRNGNSEALRNFRNSTLAEVWDPAPRVCTANELVERLCGTHPKGQVPAWGRFVTYGIDVQDSGQTFVWTACAWGPGGQGAEIAHGICGPTKQQPDGFADMLKVLDHPWPHADGGPPMVATFGLMDSGDEAETVYELCKRHPRLKPSKGLSTPFNLEFKVVTLEAEKRRNKNARGTVTLVEINTHWSQNWIQRLIEGRRLANEPDFKLSADCAFEPEYLEELLNEQSVMKPDDKGYERKSWIKVTTGPNDYRASLRYAKVAASVLTRHGKLWNQLPGRPIPGHVPSKPRVAEPTHKLLTRPDGRPWSDL